jgi:predicted ester cyclase
LIKYDCVSAAFPDTHYTIDDLMAEGCKVTLRWSYEGTHRGEWFSVAPTGKVIRTSGTSTFRIAGGKILDEFVQWDALSYMQQLGVVPASG